MRQDSSIMIKDKEIELTLDKLLCVSEGVTYNLHFIFCDKIYPFFNDVCYFFLFSFWIKLFVRYIGGDLTYFFWSGFFFVRTIFFRCCFFGSLFGWLS